MTPNELAGEFEGDAERLAERAPESLNGLATPSAEALVPVIETHDLRKVYAMGDTEVHALGGVSIRIDPGEFVAIVGPSGSGKSTLMAILGALDKPSSGSYRLDGVEIGQMSEDALSDVRNNRIGFVFQKFNLLARNTALNNVALPLIYSGVNKRERLERGRRALEIVDLGSRMDHKPNELSGGQQQRVAIARALVNNPSLILADEPTGNLDTRTGEEIMKLFRRLHQEQGITLIVVTHSPEIAEQAERVIAMRDGVVTDETIHAH
jgi:putative ABC transport system ATP-binding protein